MKIKTQLTCLVLFICFVFVLTFGLYFIISMPLEKMRSEMRCFNDIFSSLDQAVATGQRSLTTIFSISEPEIDALSTKTETAFAKLDTVTYLPGLSAEASESFRIIRDFAGLIASSLHDIQNAYNTLFEQTKKEVLVADSFSPFQLYKHHYYKNPQRDEMIVKYVKTLNLLFDKATLVKEMISEQQKIIDATMQRVRFYAFLLSAVTCIILISSGLIFSFIWTRRVSRVIVDHETQVSKLSDGELNVNFTEKGKNELSQLGKMLNGFVDYFNDSLVKIQFAIISNRKSGTDITNVIETLESVTKSTFKAVESIDEKLLQLGENIEGTQKNAETISEAISSLENNLTSHAVSLTDALNSVENINGIIQSLRGHSVDVKKNAENLVELSASGKNTLSESVMQMSFIEQQTERIKEMVTLIDNIAAETNVLAMNAGIEAAHAGDTGKGFAVVAGEIRKLAKASSDGSHSISNSVKDIVRTVQSALSQTHSASTVFDSIDGSIKGLNGDISDMAKGLSGLETGSSDVKKVMADLNTVFAELKKRFNDVCGKASTINDMMKQVDRISGHVQKDMHELTEKTKSIDTIMETSQQISTELEQVSDDLEEKISKFKMKI